MGGDGKVNDPSSTAGVLPSPMSASRPRPRTTRMPIKAAGRKPAKAAEEKPLAQEVETKRYLAMLKEQGVEGSPQEIDSAESEDEDLVISELKAGAS